MINGYMIIGICFGPWSGLGKSKLYAVLAVQMQMISLQFEFPGFIRVRAI